jgi:hypothetical protein
MTRDAFRRKVEALGYAHRAKVRSWAQQNDCPVWAIAYALHAAVRGNELARVYVSGTFYGYERSER